MQPIITPASKSNIYWPQMPHEKFIVRYCIIQRGDAVPVYIECDTYAEALKTIETAKIEQGFINAQ